MPCVPGPWVFLGGIGGLETSFSAISARVGGKPERSHKVLNPGQDLQHGGRSAGMRCLQQYEEIAQRTARHADTVKLYSAASIR